MKFEKLRGMSLRIFGAGSMDAGSGLVKLAVTFSATVGDKLANFETSLVPFG